MLEKKINMEGLELMQIEDDSYFISPKIEKFENNALKDDSILEEDLYQHLLVIWIASPCKSASFMIYSYCMIFWTSYLSYNHFYEVC